MRHIRKLLVPVDGSLCSIAALGEAVILADDLGARVEALHVEAPDRFDIGSTSATAREVGARADRETAFAVEAAQKRLGERLRFRSVAGDPVREILGTAAAEHIDLIVMGTHGRSGRLRELMGSVAENVIRNAPCPVLTVREPEGSAESFSERIHGRPSVAEQTRPSR